MATRRRRFTAAFKKRVALEALRGEQPVQAVAAKHQVHPNQVSAWKRQAVEGLDEVFSGPRSKGRSEHEETIRALHAKIGELTVERDLKRKNPTTADVPNLYSFATKELAQDATLAYILAWARPAFRESHSRLRELGTAMLHALLAKKNGETGVSTITSLDVKTQVDRIDVLVRINDENQNGVVLLVEDKVGTHEHSKQIERYIETAKKSYPNRKIVPVYVKTGNTSRRHLPSEERCGRFLRHEILEVLDRFLDTGDTIVDNFRAHLQVWKNETNSYLEVPVSEWCRNWRRYEGFYVELENRMVMEHEWRCAGWEYVSNRAGGFLCFTFAWHWTAREPHQIATYLQIEGATRLTLRLGEWKGPGIRAPFMYKVLRLLEDCTREVEEVRIRKAGRFRGGGSAAVAKITFGDEDGYLALDDRGIVDVDTTMRRLDRVRGFVAQVANRLPCSD